MKRVEERNPQTAQIVFKFLLAIIALLVLTIIAGTIAGLAKRGKAAAPPPAAALGENIFSSLGALRIPTADPEPGTIVISIAFPYDKSDRPFAEELASRISWFKTTITGFFEVLTAEEFDALDIDAAKEELLKRFNAELRLGQIRELYITDFMRL